MKLLGLHTKLLLGNVTYVVTKIERKGITLKNLSNKKLTIFPLESIIENLDNKIITLS